MIPDYLLKQKAEKFDELLTAARSEKYRSKDEGMDLFVGRKPEIDGMKVLVDLYAPTIESMRNGERINRRGRRK